MKAYYYNTRIGTLLIAENGQAVTLVELVKEDGEGEAALARLRKLDSSYEIKETELLMEAAVQLKEYFEGTRREFTMKLQPKGTVFQKKVWEALLRIPYGETRSYRQIAEEIGNTKACRAVGMANHNNPIMLFIPCHRVIGANGGMVGYAGGLDVKESLLKLEAQSR